MQPNEGNMSDFLTFNLADQHYAIPLNEVLEIRSWSQTTRIPNAPTFLLGAINLRGSVLPVIDLAERMGLPRLLATDRSAIIVSRYHQRNLGLAVKSVSNIISIEKSKEQKPPFDSKSNTLLQSIFMHNDSLLSIINLSGAFSIIEDLHA